MQTLDSALIMGNPDAQTAIKNAAAPYSNLSTYLGNQTQAADQNVANAKTQAANTQQAVQNQFVGPGGVVPQFQQDFGNRLQGAQNAYQQELANYQNLSTNPTAFDHKQFGVNPDDILKQENNLGENATLMNQTFNPNLGQFATFANAGAPTQQNFANPNDVATSQALAALTGNQGLSLAGAGQGTYSPNQIGYNQAGLTDYLTQAGNTYSNQNAINSVNQLAPGELAKVQDMTPSQLQSALYGQGIPGGSSMDTLFPGTTPQNTFSNLVQLLIRNGQLDPSVINGGVPLGTGTGGGVLRAS